MELSLRDDDSAGAIGILFDVELLVSEEGAFRHYLLTEHTTEQTTSSYTELDATRSMEEADRMREQKSKLQESYDRLERFSYGAAHDLRAPLRNISSLLDYVEEDYGQAIPKEAHGLLDTARQSARRLQALVSDLLTHARAGAEAINLEDVALKPMIKNVEKTFSEAMTAAGATIHLRCRNDTLKADPLLLRQLLENIIGNAIKYRNPNRPLRIDISLSGSGSGERSLSVRDNGIGFEPGFAEQIFEPFQRLHSTQEIEGSGVGLATVRTICKRMNWRASATGVLGEGAEFTFSGVF